MKRLVRIIKRADRESPEGPVEIEAEEGPNKWSSAVSTWVSEFQKDQRDESTPAFDSLFKDALP